MENLFITNIKVNKVRHLKDFEIDLSEQKAKHLILTGKNGCGKTSLLDAMATLMDSILGLNDLASKIQSLKNNKEILQRYQKEHRADNEIKEEQKIVEFYEGLIKKMGGGVILEMNRPLEEMWEHFEQGQFVAAYYKANRVFTAEVPKYVEKIELKSDYAIDEAPRENFIKYLLDLKMTQALAITGGKTKKQNRLKTGLINFKECYNRYSKTIL